MLARIEVDCNDEKHHISAWEPGDEKACGSEHIVHVSKGILLCYEDHDVELEETVSDLTGEKIHNTPCFRDTQPEEFNLTRAIARGNIMWIKLLLAIDENIVETSSSTPLLRAIINGNLPIIKLLVESGARVILDDPISHAAYLAIISGQPTNLDYLIEEGVNLQECNLLLDIACQQESITDQHREHMVRSLVNAGVDIHSSREEALKKAILTDQISFSRFLISQGADIKAIHEQGTFSDILSIACKYRSQIDTINFILQHNFDNKSIYNAIKVTEYNWFDDFCNPEWQDAVLTLLRSHLK
jgi:ankyrin repeat protein